MCVYCINASEEYKALESISYSGFKPYMPYTEARKKQNDDSEKIL